MKHLNARGKIIRKTLVTALAGLLFAGLAGIVVPAQLFAAAGSSETRTSLELDGDGKFTVKWNGKELVSRQQPELNMQTGKWGEWYVHETGQTVTTELAASQKKYLVVRDAFGREAFVDEGAALKFQKEGDKIVYLKDYPTTKTGWKVELCPVGDNSLDVDVEINCRERVTLLDFGIRLFDLNMQNALGDSGDIGHRERAGMPPCDQIWVGYPAGKYGYVPAAVFQDKNLALGVCLVNEHRQFRPVFGGLGIAPSQDKSRYAVTLEGNWDGLPQFPDFFVQHYRKRYRFTFSEPRQLKDGDYLRLVAAPDLWKSYLDELNECMPVAPFPKYDKSKSVLMCVPPVNWQYWDPETNPTAWVFNDPKFFPGERWQWMFDEKGKSQGAAEGWRKRGYSWENFGKPVKWVEAYANEQIQSMKQANAQAVIIWKTSWHSHEALFRTGVNYISETHFFHPEFEELMPATGAVRNWDWVEADIEVKNEKGERVAGKQGALLQAANTEELIDMNPYSKNRQVLKLKKADLTEAAKAYHEKAKMRYEQKTQEGWGLFLELLMPKDKLLGKKAGDSVELDCEPVLAGMKPEKFTLAAKITGVKRAAIDVFAKQLTDAGFEFGFLVREDFTWGVPWREYTQSFDWTSGWQYEMLKQRFQWHQQRFGPKCRWFYLDCFATTTPLYVIQRLRTDFPDMFFCAEHETDVADRIWNGSMYHEAPNALARLVNPDIRAMVMVLYGLEKNKDNPAPYVQKIVSDPNVIPLVHPHMIPLWRKGLGLDEPEKDKGGK